MAHPHPDMWKKIVKYLVLVLLLAYTAIAVVWANKMAYSQKCTGFDIVIEHQPGSQKQFVSKEGVLAELKLLLPDCTERSIGAIDIGKLERTLQRNNSYERVECYFLDNNKLQVSILPMIPEARVVTSVGSGYYINREGKHIDARPAFHTDVPVISGNFSTKFPASALLPVVRFVQKDPTWHNLVSMIYARDADNIYLIPRLKGQVICIGDTSNLPAKFANIKLMYKEVLPYKGLATYDTISVKFKGQIVATRSDKTKVHTPETPEDDGESAEEQSLQNANPQGN